MPHWDGLSCWESQFILLDLVRLKSDKENYLHALEMAAFRVPCLLREPHPTDS